MNCAGARLIKKLQTLNNEHVEADNAPVGPFAGAIKL